jgi:hypothetical protein
MPGSFRVLPGGAGKEQPHETPLPERMLFHFRNVNNSVLQEALDTWGDIWDKLQDFVTHGVLIRDEAVEPLEPKCGWPEFCEKMWLLKHYLDYAKKFSEGKA